MLENKLNITNEVELAKEEERITKLKALELFDTNKINEFEVGTTKGLCDIHKFLFNEIYSFAGEIREVNLAKGNFRFAASMYLKDVLFKIDSMPEDTFENIIKKGKCRKNQSFVIHFKKNNLPYDKYGISVSKKLGNAVFRNKYKRKLRSIIDNYRKIYN